MAVHKYALLRYRVLDKCFRSKWKRYTFDDLLDAVNEAIFEENPKSNGIKTRQLRDDIRHMKSDIGFSAPIEPLSEVELLIITTKTQIFQLQTCI